MAEQGGLTLEVLNMPNIVHVVPAIAEEASGPSYSVVRLCKSLIDQGHPVTLAALDWAPVTAPPTFSRFFPLGFGPRRMGRSPAMARWLASQAADGRTSLIHNHSLWMMPNVYTGRTAARYSIPYIVSPRGTFSEWAIQSGSRIKKLFFPLVQRPALSAVTCFHATAESEYEDIRRMGFRQPVAVIPNGIDVPPQMVRLRKGVRTLLFLGRINPIKGLDMLLPAWQAVQSRFPNWQLRIVGADNGGYLDKLRALAAELGLERVEFCGPLYGQDKWRAYGEADLFVLPTYSENFGLAVAEALAAGTPAIVTRGAPWHGLETQGAGWWIEIGLDPLVACLESALIQSSVVLAVMGQQGRDWMVRDYSWQQIGKQMAESYQWILHGGGRPTWMIED